VVHSPKVTPRECEMKRGRSWGRAAVLNRRRGGPFAGWLTGLPLVAVLAGLCLFAAGRAVAQQPPVQIGFLWHMHQPIYYPGETVTETTAAGHFSFSPTDVHNQRYGPYTNWPANAIQSGASLPHLGASVSFSGSLMQNLDNLRDSGQSQWNGWEQAAIGARNLSTTLGNPRLDLIGFTQYHALGPLLDTRDLQMQIRLHKLATQETFGTSVPLSRGFFPAETAFSTRMIPALVAEGYEWAIVDNIHFDRATQNYPHTDASNLYAPNRADAINPDPAASGGGWVQLNNLWAPSKVSAPFSYQPHNVQYVDPATGQVDRLVAVPGARYEGNEDGRGGYGALLYEQVMDQYRGYNTDPDHPLLVVLHHDGDNYGGGSEGYYHGNFQNMVNWASATPNYDVTTIQDYLDRFPVAAEDVIHVESGSWAGADNGDPQFRKWLAPPGDSGWSPDENSWAVLTAVKNRVFTADDLAPVENLENVLTGSGSPTERAWTGLLEAQASDYWYWDGTEIWDSNVTRAANRAAAEADLVLAGHSGPETTAPTVFLPQRAIYNPGGEEFGVEQPSDFDVWTFAADVSGLTEVTLKYRVDLDGQNPLDSVQNETYAGGAEVGEWQTLTMGGTTLSAPAEILAADYRAQKFSATISGITDALVDYYVEAVDAHGNLTRTDIQHVYVGSNSAGGGGGGDGGGGGGGTASPVTGFTLDGVLDAAAVEVAENSGMKLWVATDGTKLYLATNDAGEGSDHFIFLAGEPGSEQPAPWGKAGEVAAWSAFLADENDNTYSGWFDNAGAALSATGGNGGVLEGVIDLVDQFGSYPSEVYLAVGLYGSSDGGTLLASHQLAASGDGDGILQAGEYLRVPLGPPVVNFTVETGLVTQAEAGYDVMPGVVGLAKRGGGTLVLDRANGHAGITTVSAGTLLVTAADALADSPTVIEAGGVLAVGDGQAVSLPSLDLAGGQLDLGIGRVTVAAGLSEADVREAILAGLGDGSWTGPGVVSSAAASAAAGSRTVGYVVNADGSVTLAFAAAGDANLDGQVDIFDLLVIDSKGGYGTVQAASWAAGDMNHDGAVNVFDLLAIDGAGAYGGGSYLPAVTTAAVPEPAALAAAGMAAALCLLRRRRER
jgi:autotransporter-associated beta strand protein